MFTYSTIWSNVNEHKIKLEYPVDYISLLEPMVSMKIELKFSTGFRCSWRTRGRRGCNRYRPNHETIKKNFNFIYHDANK